MSFNISDLPDPENRTAQQWVTYYFRVENAVALGQTVEVNGKRISHHNINDIVRQRMSWENRVARAAGKASGVSAYAPTYIG